MWSALLVLVGCAARARVEVSGVMAASGPFRVTAPVVVADLPSPPPGAETPAPAPTPPGPIEAQLDQVDATVLDPVRDGAFLRNDFVGNIRFGGGLIKTGDIALETRARLIELQPGGALEVQGVEWLTGLVPGSGVAPEATFRHAHTRGMDEEDGHDNLNLPRTQLVPVSIASQEALLVPYLRAYYTHNGGWFLGQRWGCLAGARVDVVIVLWEDGAPRWWVEVTGRSISSRVAQATTAELDAHLLEAEEQVEREVRRRL